MSVQHQGVGAGGGCAPSRAELKIIYGVKNEQNIRFRQLFPLIRGKLSTCTCIVYMNDGYSRGGGSQLSRGGGERMPPPPKRNPARYIPGEESNNK